MSEIIEVNPVYNNVFQLIEYSYFFTDETSIELDESRRFVQDWEGMRSVSSDKLSTLSERIGRRVYA